MLAARCFKKKCRSNWWATRRWPIGGQGGIHHHGPRAGHMLCSFMQPDGRRCRRRRQCWHAQGAVQGMVQGHAQIVLRQWAGRSRGSHLARAQMHRMLLTKLSARYWRPHACGQDTQPQRQHRSDGALRDVQSWPRQHAGILEAHKRQNRAEAHSNQTIATSPSKTLTSNIFASEIKVSLGHCTSVLDSEFTR